MKEKKMKSEQTGRKETTGQTGKTKYTVETAAAFPGDLRKKLKYDYLRRELWVPLKSEYGRFTVLLDDPQNIIKRDMIESLLKTKTIVYCRGSSEEIIAAIDRFFDLDENGVPRDNVRDQPSESDSVIVQIINRMIADAFAKRASDIHIEPDMVDHHVTVRFRIDGECLSYEQLPYIYRAAIVSRIKIMANLDITEKRLPQDGKIRFTVPNFGDIELRVATVPTHGGVEDVVLRILTRGSIMAMGELNMSAEDLSQFLKILKKPYGLVLIVGPTGSGKTTTAHAALQILNKPNVKIWTAEDPVEITQKGLRQVQVHHKIGFDFSSAMRAFLRSDPDIILVGEMRDYETAKMGIEASTTGHLVMSTLHTNNAPETIVRLLEMGIDPIAFADSLLCILAQRLVRRICPHCKVAYHPSREEFDDIVRSFDEKLFARLGIAYNDHFTLYKPRGCAACNETGYRGMSGLFELLIATDEIKHMIISRKPMPALRRISMSQGMRTLLQDGIVKALRGETDLPEVLSVCMR